MEQQPVTKAILITGTVYARYIREVDVKETEKSYMVDGIRFKKGEENGELLGTAQGSGGFTSRSRLYRIDSPTAQAELEKVQHSKRCGAISDMFKNPSKVDPKLAKRVRTFIDQYNQLQEELKAANAEEPEKQSPD